MDDYIDLDEHWDAQAAELDFLDVARDYLTQDYGQPEG